MGGLCGGMDSQRRARSPEGTSRNHPEAEGKPHRRQGQEGIRQIADAGRTLRVSGTVVFAPVQAGTEGLRTQPIATGR